MASGPFQPYNLETQQAAAFPTHTVLSRHHSDHFLSEQDLTEGSPAQLWLSLPLWAPLTYTHLPRPTLPFC